MRRRAAAAVFLAVLGAASAVAADLGDAAFKRWVKDLAKARTASQRAEAAENLGRQGRPEAATPLAQALGDPEAEVRAAAAGALWALGEEAKPAEPALWEALDDRDLEVVVRAAGALDVLDADPARLAPPRRRALASTDLTIRFLAARGLIGQDPPPALLPHVLDYLDRESARAAAPDTDYKVREAAEHNRELAEKALASLVATQDRGLAQPLVQRVGRDHPAQPAILSAMGALAPPPDGWDELLAARMASRETKTRRVAAELARGRTAPDQTGRWVPAATRLLSDTDETVRSAALWALSAAGGLAAEAVPTLVGQLTAEPDPDRRELVARVLGDVGDRSQPVARQVKAEVAATARPALERALAGDRESDVRQAALDSLDRLDLEPGVMIEILVKVLRTPGDRELTWAALQDLRNRGLESAPALDAIRSLTTSPDAQLADYATTIAGELQRSMEEKAGRKGAAPAKVAAAKPAPAAGASDPAAEARGLAVLRTRGAAVDEDSYAGALMQADAELIEAYLDAGLGANRRFEAINGRQPLHLLFFTRAACDPAVRPTPAATAALLDLLLARGADANGTDENGNTPLMFAADKCDAAIVKRLVAAGARVGATNGSGMTALEMSMWSGNDGLGALIDAGARLKPETAAAYREAYKANPQALSLIDRAARK